MRFVSGVMGAVFLICALGLAQAQPGRALGVEQIETRPGVHVPVFEVWQPGAVATLVLFSGGGGGYGRIGPGGWPESKNFLIRTGPLWAAQPFNLVMVGRPSDGLVLQDGAVRIGDAHAADNLAILQAIRRKSDRPIWLVGTSMGTISAAAAAIRDTEQRVAGVVLTSSVTAYRRAGAVPKQDLSRIRVPVLVLHHARDACAICVPAEASYILKGLENAPAKELVLFEGGGGESGDPCEPLHFHGFIHAEKEVVDLIAAWIQKHTP
jgi:pimeloyl-ACP methyl ester carboxylesterase